MKKFQLVLLIFFGILFKGYPQCWKSVSGGRENTFAITIDSTLWGWGPNDNGQLADGTFYNYAINMPRQISATHNWESVSVGQFYVVAIKTDGTLWAWGDNYSGQLGNGTDGNGTSTNVPTQVGVSTDWKTVIAAGDQVIAIKADGTLWSWGINTYGQLGDGTNTFKNIPTQIGTSGNWKSVSISGYHTVALQADGSLWAWGRNVIGQLGDGTTTDKNTPTRIGTANNWQSVSAGSYYTMAIKTDGTLWAWGDNYAGALGDGTGIDRYSPVQIGTDMDWKSVTANNSTLAIKTDSTLWSWGWNQWGDLGDGTYIDKSVPTQVGVAHNWINVYAARFGEHVLAFKADSSLWAWGYNGFGQLGDGTWADKTIPTFISCQPGEVVPVILTKFNASLKSKNALLQWETSQETNTSKFVIEKSVNANEWITIGTVKAIGNSGFIHNYSFVDYNINSSFYYRLAMVDLDGKTTHSKIQRVTVIENSGVSFYPNPANESITLKNAGSIAIKKIILTDLLGQKILERTNNFQKIDLSQLKNGTYILNIFSNDKTYRLKLVKQ